jgi:hypothetical protein
MARTAKKILTGDGVDRRATGYYATPGFVAEFLTARMLAQKPGGRRVLDPCVGREELLAGFAAAGKAIDGLDVADFGAHARARFERADFLRRVAAWKRAPGPRPWPYDYYIANPPYNCHEADYIRRHKAELVRAFGDVGIANTSALFLAGMLETAQAGALIGVVALDSLLTAKLNAPLRRRIRETCALHLVALCPTDLFRDQRADVRTCLLVLEKGGRQGEVEVLNRPLDTAAFRRALAAPLARRPLAELVLDGPADNAEIVVGCPADVRALFDGPRLGERFRTATGISTGNDRRFVRAAPAPGHDVPFYKNPGSRRFRQAPDGYLPRNFVALAARHATFLVRNRDLLGQPGIACSSMGVRFAAAALPAGATFGVNPNVFPPAADRDWLLAYLNSSLVTYLVRGVLLRTNMITAGYVARLPLVAFSAAERRKLAQLAAAAVARGERPDTLARIDAIVFKAAGLASDTIANVKAFARDVVRAT